MGDNPDFITASNTMQADMQEMPLIKIRLLARALDRFRIGYYMGDTEPFKYRVPRQLEETSG